MYLIRSAAISRMNANCIFRYPWHNSEGSGQIKWPHAPVSMSNLSVKPTRIGTSLYNTIWVILAKYIIIAGTSSNIQTWGITLTRICHYILHYPIPRNYKQHRLSVSNFIHRQVPQWFSHKAVAHSRHNHQMILLLHLMNILTIYQSRYNTMDSIHRSFHDRTSYQCSSAQLTLIPYVNLPSNPNFSI